MEHAGWQKIKTHIKWVVVFHGLISQWKSSGLLIGGLVLLIQFVGAFWPIVLELAGKLCTYMLPYIQLIRTQC